MQEQLVIRKPGGTGTRAAAFVPLTHLQQNVLPARVRSLQSLQQAKPAAQEEIDSEALQCLSAQDLQAIGITDPNHRRKLLSAALQLQNAPAHTVICPSGKPFSKVATTTHSKQTCDGVQHIAPAALGPNLIVNALNSLASTVIQPKSAQQAAPQRQASLTAAPSTASAALKPHSLIQHSHLVQPQLGSGRFDVQSLSGATATCRARMQADAAGCTRDHSNSSSSNASAEPDVPNKSRKIKHIQTAGRQPQMAGPPAVKVQGYRQVQSQSTKAEAPSSSLREAEAGQKPRQQASTIAAVRSNAGRTSQHAHSSTSAVRGNAWQTSQHTESSAPAAMARQGGVLAPKSKADEEHHLALALSASMGEPLTGNPAVLLQAKPNKSATAEGVFSTMMTASRQSSKHVPASQPSSSKTDAADVHTNFSRQAEQSLLDKVFTDVVCTSLSPPVQLHLFGSSAAATCCCSEATAVQADASLWKQAGADQPPHCTLEERVQKRKAEQLVAQEQARQEALARRCSAAEAMLRSCEVAGLSQSGRDAADGPLLESQSCSSSAHQTACIDLALSLAQGTQRSVLCPVSTEAGAAAVNTLQSVKDPMKRIRLLALQQELKAARQTVADLERMIAEVRET